MRKAIIALIVAGVVSATLAACTTEEEMGQREWKESPTFEVGDYNVRGNEDSLAIDDLPFIAGESESYTMYFWSDQETLMSGPVKIEAVHESSEEKEKAIVNFSGTEDEEKVWEAGVPQIGGDQAHLPVTLSLPDEGLWRLDVFIGDDKFDELIVDVQASEEA